MLTLALDTTADIGSLALVSASTLREQLAIHAPQGFSHVLFHEIDALLQRHNLSLPGIDLFAAAAGPGSFTGVRVGLSAIKGLAEVLHKPAIAISNLEALAQFGTAPLRVPIIDARRGEVYAAIYDEAGHQPIPETVLPFDRFLALIAARGFDPLNIQWVSQGFELPPDFHVIPAPPAIAHQIALLAMRKAAAGFSQDPVAIDANYVRRSDAELLWKG